MPTDVIMPVLGMNQDTAVLLAWRKREGDTVTEGEPLMEVETDKATIELEAPASGTLTRITATDGDKVPAGSVIAVILAEGESAPGGTNAGARGGAAPTAPAGDGRVPAGGTASPGEGGAGSSPPHRSATPPTTATQAHTPPTPAAPPPTPTHRARLTPASPKARALASKRGLNITDIPGSGPEGAVLAADVLRVAAAPAPQPGRAAAPAAGAAWGSFARELDAEALLSAVARVRAARRGDPTMAHLETIDVLTRMATAVWSAGGAHDHDGPLAVSRVADGTASSYVLAMDGGIREAVAARQASVGSEGPAPEHPAALALLDLSSSRIDVGSAPGPAPSGAPLGIVVGRPSPRGDGSASLRLVLSFDPGRVDAPRAAVFFDRLLGLVEDPASLLLFA